MEREWGREEQVQIKKGDKERKYQYMNEIKRRKKWYDLLRCRRVKIRDECDTDVEEPNLAYASFSLIVYQ